MTSGMQDATSPAVVIIPCRTDHVHERWDRLSKDRIQGSPFPFGRRFAETNERTLLSREWTVRNKACVGWPIIEERPTVVRLPWSRKTLLSSSGFFLTSSSFQFANPRRLVTRHSNQEPTPSSLNSYECTTLFHESSEFDHQKLL